MTSDLDIATNLVHLSLFNQSMDDDDVQPKKTEPAPAAHKADIAQSKSGRGAGATGKKRVQFNNGLSDDEIDLEDDEFMAGDSIPS
jgi:hypothetical protein